MEFKVALQRAADGDKSHAVIDTIYNAVEPLCKTWTDGEDGTATLLWDWLEAGEYFLSDTPQSIAAEWDALDPTNTN